MPPVSSSHVGPHIGALAIVFTVLFLGSLALLAILTQGDPFPMPLEPVDNAKQFYKQFASTVRLISFLQFGAAIPLGIFTASITSRLRYLGIRASGVTIALFGGLMASFFLALSGIFSWIVTQPDILNDTATFKALELLAFTTGGVAHIAGLGLLLAGVSMTALVGNYIPKWLCILGLILAAIAEISTFSLISPGLNVLLPIARLPAFLWMIGSGFTIAKRRRERGH